MLDKLKEFIEICEENNISGVDIASIHPIFLRDFLPVIGTNNSKETKQEKILRLYSRYRKDFENKIEVKPTIKNDMFLRLKNLIVYCEMFGLTSEDIDSRKKDFIKIFFPCVLSKNKNDKLSLVTKIYTSLLEITLSRDEPYFLKNFLLKKQDENYYLNKEHTKVIMNKASKSDGWFDLFKLSYDNEFIKKTIENKMEYFYTLLDLRYKQEQENGIKKALQKIAKESDSNELLARIYGLCYALDYNNGIAFLVKINEVNEKNLLEVDIYCNENKSVIPLKDKLEYDKEKDGVYLVKEKSLLLNEMIKAEQIYLLKHMDNNKNNQIKKKRI